MKLLQYSKEKANRLRPMGLLFQFQERSNFCPEKICHRKIGPERKREGGNYDFVVLLHSFYLLPAIL